MSKKNVIFTPEEIAAACDAAVASGKGLGAVFSVDMANVRGDRTKFMTIVAATPSKSGPVRLRVRDEVHSGRIDPKSEAEVKRLNEASDSKYGMIVQRDRAPELKINKYKVRVETDEQARPVGDLPGPEMESKLFKVAAHLDTWFRSKAKEMLKSGKIASADWSAENPGAPLLGPYAPNTKVSTPVQKTISFSSKDNPGAPLANPILRVKLKFSEDGTASPRTLQMFDKDTKSKNAQGMTIFEPLAFEGEPATDHNIHLLPPRSEFDGVVLMDTLCISSMGISAPMSVKTLVISPARAGGAGGLVDMGYDDEDDGADDGASGGAAAAIAEMALQ